MAVLTTGWVTISNLVDTGDDVSSRLDAAFNAVDNNATILNQNAGFNRTFNYDTATNVVIGSDLYTSIASLNVAGMDAGTYVVGISEEFTTDDASVTFQYSTDNGTSWNEVSANQGQGVMSTFATVVHSAGDFNILVEGKCANTGKSLTISKSEITLDRRV